MRYVRPAPERPGMPILGYFVVVGCTLLSLLFAADLYLPKNEHLSFASNVDGLPEAYKGEPKHAPPPAAPHIAPLPAIVETTGSGSSSGMALAADEPKPQAAPAAREAAKPAKRKVVRRHQPEVRDEGFGSFGRQDFGRQDYARQDFPRQDFGRQGFGSREPSWRDSWASGAFQQEPRSRRNASRSGNDFGFFR